MMRMIAGGRSEPPQEWHRGCAECFTDIGSCAEAWCLPCCYLGFVSGALKHRSDRSGNDWDCGMCCASAMVTYMLGPCGFGLFVWTTRNQIVQRYNITNDSAGCPIACFCPVCALVQQASHIKYRGGWGGSVCSSAQLTDQMGRNDTGNPIIQMGGAPMPPSHHGSPNQFNTSYPPPPMMPPPNGYGQPPPPQGYQQQQPPQGYQGQYYGQQPTTGNGAAPPPPGHGANSSWNQATGNNSDYNNNTNNNFNSTYPGPGSPNMATSHNGMPGFYQPPPPPQGASWGHNGGNSAAPQNLPPPSFQAA